MNFHPIETAKEHPIITAVIAGAIILYFFWPSSSGTNSANINSQEEQAIADSASANASLQVAQDQVQIAGLNDSAAQAINSNNNAAAVSIATLGANVDSLNLNDALQATLNGNATNLSIAQLALQSQSSAEQFIQNLESLGLNTPAVSAPGFTASGTSSLAGLVNYPAFVQPFVSSLPSVNTNTGGTQTAGT